MTPASRFEQALLYASRLHQTQRRKVGGAPYISHLLAVTSLVLEHGGDEEEAIAALLHDAIEDHGAGRREEIEQRFGDRVAAIVEGCSDADGTPKPPWKQRKQAFLARLSQASPSVRLVAAADKLHNARGMLAAYRRLGEPFWNAFRGGKQGTLWYYRALVGAFRHGGGLALVDELDEAVGELERMAQRPKP